MVVAVVLVVVALVGVVLAALVLAHMLELHFAIRTVWWCRWWLWHMAGGGGIYYTCYTAHAIYVRSIWYIYIGACTQHIACMPHFSCMQ